MTLPNDPRVSQQIQQLPVGATQALDIQRTQHKYTLWSGLVLERIRGAMAHVEMGVEIDVQKIVADAHYVIVEFEKRFEAVAVQTPPVTN